MAATARDIETFVYSGAWIEGGRRVRGRKTGGRKRGVPNKATILRRLRAEEGVRNALATGTSPLEVVLCVMRGGPEADAITDRQLLAAQAALPFVHPRLTATAITHSALPAGTLTHEERLAMLERGPEVEGEAEELPDGS